MCVIFFFKQKTAYELRISDWSSDVCSSDLLPTLRIRCQRVRFATPEAEVARNWMAEQGVRDEDALELALGAPLRAVALQQNDGIAIRHQWAELWSAVASARKDPLTAAAAIDKESLAEHLQWAQQWLVIRLRELLVTSAAASQREGVALMLQDVGEAQRRAAGNANAQMLDRKSTRLNSS